MSDVDPEPADAEAEGVPSVLAGPEVRPSPPVDADGRSCEVALEEFEGPLDLLLHLVRRHELDILDIPISFVCEKFLEYIDFMHALDLEVAGDYLVMAATLAYLKSRELVPQQDEMVVEGSEEEGPDPREQLIMRLLEYQKFKDAAARLDRRPIAGRDTFGRGQEVELPPVDSGLAPITLFRLAEAYSRVLERARIHKSHEVVMETISVAARMEQLTGVLINRSRFEFENLFLEREWSSEAELRSMLVVTLMSVLELVRMGVASVYQSLGSETIVVERVASAAEAREALRDYDESLSFGEALASEDESDDGASDAVDAVVAEAVTNEGVTATDVDLGAGIEPAANEAVSADSLGMPREAVESDVAVEDESFEAVADELGEVTIDAAESEVAEVSSETVEASAETVGVETEESSSEAVVDRVDDVPLAAMGGAVAKETPPGTVEAPFEEVPQEAAEAPTEDVPQEAAEAPVQEAEEAPTEEVAQEAAEAPVEEVPQEAEEAPTEEVAQEAAEAPFEEVAQEAVEAPFEEVAQEAAVAPVEEAAESPFEDVPQEAAEAPCEDVPQEVAEAPFEEAPQEVAEAPTEEVSQEASEESAEAAEAPEQVASADAAEAPFEEAPLEESTEAVETPVEVSSFDAVSLDAGDTLEDGGEAAASDAPSSAQHEAPIEALPAEESPVDEVPSDAREVVEVAETTAPELSFGTDASAQVTEPASRGAGFEATEGGSDSADGPVGPGAGASGRSVVSESPPVGAADDGVDEAVLSPEPGDGASETTEGDGQEHGENGEA